MPITMATLQGRYQSIPFGWKEIDIAKNCRKTDSGTKNHCKTFWTNNTT